MMRSMMNMSWWRLFLSLAVTYTTAAAAAAATAGPGSCVGRCGESFARGQLCTCDFDCLRHHECCQDFQALCTNNQSCQGRCGETFRRGRLCECDPQCIQYNTCCHDYQLHCDASVSVSQPRTFRPLKAAASARGRCPQYPGGQCPGALGLLNPRVASSTGPALPATPTNPRQHGGSDIPVNLLPLSNPSSHGGAPDLPAAGSSLGSSAPMGPSGPGAVGGKVNVHLLLPAGGVAPYMPSQGLSGPTGSRPRPSTLQDIAQALGLSLVEEGPEGPGTGLSAADVDLCGDSPIDGLTALSNGTILIFKGELFWSVDPASRTAGCPQRITDALGVSSPVGTVFTRCNCHGNTYVIQGDQYWRLDGNMVMEPGYPKPLTSEFPGLTGSISAALAVPATRSRPETVYFFKKGDIMQRFTFPPDSAPPCGKKPSGLARKPGVLLSAELDLRVSLRGFPTPVTSALSVPSPRSSGRYEHYVFSGPLFFSVQISGDLPALAKPDPSATFGPLPLRGPTAAAQGANPAPPANSIRAWLRCPQAHPGASRPCSGVSCVSAQ